MQIVDMKISDLVHAPYNPRKKLKPGDREYEKLKKSIQEFGYVDPIIWNKRSGRVVGGHQRLQVLQDIGETVCSVSVVDLPEDREKALNLALNKIAGEWELPALKEILLELDTGDFDIELTGFDSEEIRDLNANIGPSADVEEDDFDAEAEADKIVEPITKTGDVWLLGKHRVMCGDSTKKEDVGRLCAKQGVNLLLTDPPYGVSYAAKNEYLNAISRGNRIQTPIKNDHESPEDMKKLWVAAFTEAHDALAPGAAYYVTGPQGGDLLLLLLLSLKESGLILKHMLIWVKNNHVLGRADYNYKHEPIIYGWKAGGHKFYGPSNEVSTWQINKPQKSDLHPTMKPVELFARAITNSTQANAIVYDPFCGSGTSVIACEQLNRICYGMEIDPVYCDVIVKRWEEFTGKKAELLKDEGQKTDTVQTAPAPGRKKKNAPAAK